MHCIHASIFEIDIRVSLTMCRKSINQHIDSDSWRNDPLKNCNIDKVTIIFLMPEKGISQRTYQINVTLNI